MEKLQNQAHHECGTNSGKLKREHERKIKEEKNFNENKHRALNNK